MKTLIAPLILIAAFSFSVTAQAGSRITAESKPLESIKNSTCWAEFTKDQYRELLSIDSSGQIHVPGVDGAVNLVGAVYFEPEFIGQSYDINIFRTQFDAVTPLEDLRLLKSDGRPATAGRIAANSNLFDVLSEEGVWSLGAYAPTLDGEADNQDVICAPTALGKPAAPSMAELSQAILEQKDDSLKQFLERNPERLLRAWKEGRVDASYGGGNFETTIKAHEACIERTYQFNIFTRDFKVKHSSDQCQGEG